MGSQHGHHHCGVSQTQRVVALVELVVLQQVHIGELCKGQVLHVRAASGVGVVGVTGGSGGWVLPLPLTPVDLQRGEKIFEIGKLEEGPEDAE